MCLLGLIRAYIHGVWRNNRHNIEHRLSIEDKFVDVVDISDSDYEIKYKLFKV